MEVSTIDKAQLLKGLLEGCILQIIRKEESYGYAITEALQSFGFTDLNEGSVYPVLIRLEKKGMITGESRKSDLGPKRKYFQISSLGREYLEDFKNLWDDVSLTVNTIMKGGENHE